MKCTQFHTFEHPQMYVGRGQRPGLVGFACASGSGSTDRCSSPSTGPFKVITLNPKLLTLGPLPIWAPPRKGTTKSVPGSRQRADFKVARNRVKTKHLLEPRNSEEDSLPEALSPNTAAAKKPQSVSRMVVTEAKFNPHKISPKPGRAASQGVSKQPTGPLGSGLDHGKSRTTRTTATVDVGRCSNYNKNPGALLVTSLSHS